MANPLTDFRNNVEAVAAEHRRSSTALLRQLKQLSPQELLRRGPKLWSKLSIAEYHEVIQAIAPRVRIPIARDNAVEPAPMPNAFRRWWRARSALAQSTCLTALFTIIVTAVVVAGWPVLSWSLVPHTLVRPLSTSTWPPCGRLAWNTDGCVYIATIDLNWDWIAWHLKVPTTELLRINKHLPDTYVPAGSQVIVWRSRGRLKVNPQ